MGHGESSMFYLVVIFLAVYAVGMCAYLIYGKVKEAIVRKRDSRFGGREDG